MPSMTFVILAKSVKHKRFCIAGKIYRNGEVGNWIRPVNPTAETDALTHSHIEYANKQRPEILHITTFNYIQIVSHPIQRENHSIDTSFYWDKTGVFNKKNINDLLDNPHTIWLNDTSSFSGRNDRYPIRSVTRPIQSLYFLYVQNLRVRVKAEGANFGDDLKKFRGLFSYNGCEYHILITDPQIYSDYGRHPEGIYEIGACYITLSTAPHNDGYCYKFIAAIIS